MNRSMSNPSDPLTESAHFDADTLTAVHGIAAWGNACFNPAAPDSVFHHAPNRVIGTWSHFLGGGARQPGADLGHAETAVCELAGVSAVSLAGALLDPMSMAIFSPARGFYAPSGGSHAALRCESSSQYDGVVTPVAGVEIHDIRHFLYNGLPSAVMLRGMLGPRLLVAGPVLQPWQTELLAALGLDQGYFSIAEPTRFTRIIATDMMRPEPPSRFARGAIDRLRFRFGQDHVRTRRLLIGDGQKAWGDDWSAIEAEAEDFGFEPVDLAPLSMAERARLFASATAVIGPSGAALALVGFCDPGTAILELQTTALLEGWTRVLCAVFGLEWYNLIVSMSDITGETLLDRGSLRICLKNMAGAA